MLLISHRGNLNGPNKASENNPKQIKYVLNLGFNCEVDVWYENGRFLLGHDEPQFKVTQNFLRDYRIWSHCKNIEALNILLKDIYVNCFWHENDTVAITSQRYIWASPTKIAIPNSIALIPEKRNTVLDGCFGICSDFIINYVGQ